MYPGQALVLGGGYVMKEGIYIKDDEFRLVLFSDRVYIINYWKY